MVKISDLPDYSSANTISEKLKAVQNYFRPKMPYERVDSELIWDLVHDVLKKPIDEINLEKASINSIISSYGTRHKEQMNYFIDELIRREFYLFNDEILKKYLNKMAQPIQKKIIDDNVNIDKNNTRNYINFFAESRDPPNNYELFQSAHRNEYFINLFQENILEHFSKEIKNTSLNTYTFDSLKDYKINFTTDFQTQIAELIQSSSKNSDNIGLIRGAIVGLKINYRLFREEIIKELLNKYSELAISGFLGESNLLNALTKNGLLLKDVINQTEEICLVAVRSNGMALEYVKEQTPNICLVAIQNNGMALRYVKEQTDELCLVAVQSNGLALQYVSNQTEQVCLEAVKSNGLALQYVSNQTEQVCLEAVKSNGLALRFVKNKNDIISLEAVRSNGLAIEHVINKTKDICLVAFEQNGLALKFFDVDLFNELTTDSKILEMYSKNTNYENLLLIIYNKNGFDNENKVKKIDQFFSLYVRHLLSKERNLNDIIKSSKSIININNDTDYYHSFVLEKTKNPNEIFNSDRFIWFSDRFDQALLHLFNNARRISDIDKSTLIELYIAKFKLEKEIKIINSNSPVNNSVFDSIIPSKCLNDIINALKERHHYYILLTVSKEKLLNQSKQWFANGEFANENNKFILVILNELNIFLTEENKVYGYSNKYDQKEIALIGRNNLINQSSIQISRYTRVIKRNGTEISFPITYDNYHKEFSNEYITLYSNFNELPQMYQDQYNYKERDNHFKMRECMEKKGIKTNSYRMYKKDNAKIFYQDFDNLDHEIEFVNLEYDEYWRNKYLKYKAKYLALKNKN